MNARNAGFLVVRSLGSGAVYEGIDRVPEYPTGNKDDAEALEFYVLGDCKDPDTNLIPTLEVATALRERLSRPGRSYEVLLCCEGPQSAVLEQLPAGSAEHLGFDVAATSADYWSIVDDFSSQRWALRFRRQLNRHGLFESHSEAEQYLREYKHSNEADTDSPLEVLYVVRVRATGAHF